MSHLFIQVIPLTTYHHLSLSSSFINLIFQARDLRVGLTRLSTLPRQICPGHRSDRIIGKDIQAVIDGHLDFYYRKHCYEELSFSPCPRLHECAKIFGNS